MKTFKRIESLLKQYSPADIWKALFILDTWLLNISSPIKISVLYWIFLSIDKDNFSKEDSILTYHDFHNFFNHLIKIIPQFPLLEDFIPVSDRGEVKIEVKNKNYNILYGGEVDNIYDLLEYFKIIFGDINYELNNTDPILDLKNILEYQTYLVNNLASLSPNISELSNWCFELPPENFFINCVNFLNNNFNNRFREKYITELWTLKYSTIQDIINDIFSNKFLSKLFLSIEWKNIPMMPRRFPEVLFQSWLEIFKEKLQEKDFREKLNQNININSHLFLENRISKNNLWGSINCIFDKQSNSVLWKEFFWIISLEKKIILFYNIPFFHIKNKEERKMRLENENEIILENLKHIESSLLIYDIIHRQYLEYKKWEWEYEIIPIGILPIFPLDTLVLETPNKYTWYIWSPLDFVTIIDECDNIHILWDFLDWMKENESNISIWTIKDIFIWFKNKDGVITEWALHPNWMFFDHTISNNHRYENLSKFRSVFPDAKILNNPRAWILEINDNIPIVRLKNERNRFFWIIKIKNTHLLIHFLVEKSIEPTDKQLKCYELITECLSYYLKKYSKELGGLTFFDQKRILQISIFCNEYAKDNNLYGHIKHLYTKNYKIDSWKIDNEYYWLRLCFNTQYFINQFSKDTNKAEIELFNILLSWIKNISQESIPTELIKKLKIISWEKPWFKINFIENVPFNFPWDIPVLAPENKHYLKAKKELSKILLEKEITPGTYMIDEWKEKIDEIRSYCINYINCFISQFSFEKSITFLIENFDALLFDNWKTNHKKKLIKDLSIDYDPVEFFSQKNEVFLDNVKNYRYCIEKFICLSPKGKEKLNKDNLQFLLALIDWLFVFQSASDTLHYQLFSSWIVIDDDFNFKVTYTEDIESLWKKYSEFETKIQLWKIGNKELKIKVENTIINDLRQKIDKSFNEDLWFWFIEMMEILHFLSSWWKRNRAEKYKLYNQSSLEEIFKEVTEIISIDFDKFNKIIDFLTIKPEEILLTYNKETWEITNSHKDIPIWEHIKRFSRYHLKPLIKINNHLFRGCVTTRKTMDVWLNHIDQWKLPTYYNLENSLKVMEEYKSFLDKTLENYVYKKSLMKFWKTTIKNFEFLKQDPKSSPIHKDVGDYDVICYNEETNTLWLFECKELWKPYSMKDSQRLRNNIFNIYVPKIINREKYMKEHLDIFKRLVKWNIKDNPTIKSVYISSYIYWRTQNPIQETNIKFIPLQLLYDTLDWKLNLKR